MASFITQGTVLRFTVTTQNEPNGTVLYFTYIDTAASFLSESTPSREVQNNTTAVATVGLRNDAPIGNTLTIRVHIDSPTGRILATRSFTVASGSSSTPTYSIDVDNPNPIAGSTVNFQVATRNVALGTRLYFTYVGTQFLQSYIDNNTVQNCIGQDCRTTGYIILRPAGSPPTGVPAGSNIRIQIRTGSETGPIVAESSLIVSSGGSVTPTYNITVSNLNPLAGTALSFNVNTANVANGTRLYYTYSGTAPVTNQTLDSQVTNTPGTNTGIALGSLTVGSGATTGQTIIITARTGSSSGNPVAASQTIAVASGGGGGGGGGGGVQSTVSIRFAPGVLDPNGYATPGSRIDFTVTTTQIPENTLITYNYTVDATQSSLPLSSLITDSAASGTVNQSGIAGGFFQVASVITARSRIYIEAYISGQFRTRQGCEILATVVEGVYELNFTPIQEILDVAPPQPSEGFPGGPEGYLQYPPELYGYYENYFPLDFWGTSAQDTYNRVRTYGGSLIYALSYYGYAPSTRFARIAPGYPNLDTSRWIQEARRAAQTWAEYGGVNPWGPGSLEKTAAVPPPSNFSEESGDYSSGFTPVAEIINIDPPDRPTDVEAYLYYQGFLPRTWGTSAQDTYNRELSLGISLIWNLYWNALPPSTKAFVAPPATGPDDLSWIYRANQQAQTWEAYSGVDPFGAELSVPPPPPPPPLSPTSSPSISSSADALSFNFTPVSEILDIDPPDRPTGVEAYLYYQGFLPDTWGSSAQDTFNRELTLGISNIWYLYWNALPPSTKAFVAPPATGPDDPYWVYQATGLGQQWIISNGVDPWG